ncbi:MAG: AI-2E family transporter [Ktedonobacterales bacterium]
MRDMLERHRSLQALIGLAIVALIVYIVHSIWSALTIVGDVFLIFLLAWIVMFILEPLSGRLQRLGLPRIVAVSVIYLALLLAGVGMAALAAPIMAAETTSLAARIGVLLSPTAGANGLSAQIVSLLKLIGFSQRNATSLSTQLVTQAHDSVASLSHVSVGSASQLLGTIGTVMFDATLVVIISFYMMMQGDVLVEAVVVRLPPRWLPDARLFQRYITDIFAGFFRAQLIVAAIYGALTWLILAFFGLGDAWFVALISGALIWLPFIGAFLAVVPPLLLVAVVTPSHLLLIKLAILGLLLGAAQHIALNLIAPRVFGQHMRVPTLILFAALLLGAGEGGVWGAFFAGPVVAVAYAILEVFYGRFSASSALFQGEAQLDEEQAELRELSASRFRRRTSPTRRLRRARTDDDRDEPHEQPPRPPPKPLVQRPDPPDG